jgi:uncharacterized protein YjbI with pentapeptide repeats
MVRTVLYGGVVIMLFQCVLFTGIGYGFDNAHFQKLNSTNKCEKCDLSNVNLANLDMYGANLAGANLSGANLSEASFNDANLTGANLTGANIKGTNFSGAKLSNTIWVDGKKCQSGSIGKCK